MFKHQSFRKGNCAGQTWVMRYVTAFFNPQQLQIAALNTAAADLKGFQNLSGLDNPTRPIGFAGFGLRGLEE